MNISFFIGSGFSIPIGLPSVLDISKYIIDHQKRFGIQNQLFSELLDIYLEHNPKWNYEEFYDFLGVICSHPKNYFCEIDKSEIDSAKELRQYHEKNIWVEDYIKINKGKFPKISDLDYPKFMQEFNHFLKKGFCQTEDALKVLDFSSREANNVYLKFVKLLNIFSIKADIVNLFTTNHDNLIENIIVNDYKLVKHFCDGFDTQNSQFYFNSSKGKIILPQYVANYAKKLRIFKLHGSLDYYRTLFPADNLLKLPVNFTKFNHIDQKNKNHNSPIKCDVTPQFITGKYKDVYYREVVQYKTQFDFFKKDLPQSDILIIIGYGFPDTEINEILREILEDPSKKKIVIDFHSETDTEKPRIFESMGISEPNCIKYNIKVSLTGAIDFDDDIFSFLEI